MSMRVNSVLGPNQHPIARTMLSAGTAMLAAVAIGDVGAPAANAASIDFTPGDLAVTYSVYPGLVNPYTGSTGGYTTPDIVAGETVLPISPGPVLAVDGGSYPNVFENETVDPNFGVTSPIYLGEITPNGTMVSTTDLTALTGITNSFSSKSELAVNLSTAGNALTLGGYNAPVGELDVSNANTPGHIDPTNTDIQNPTQRSIIQVNANGSVLVTNTNAYSGNNGRASILANNVNGSGLSEYLMVGNAGNGSGTPPDYIVSNTGVQTTTPGGSPDTTVIGAHQGTVGANKGSQYGFSVTQTNPATGMAYGAADKSGKDNNFRGETIFDNTLYVTKGSGSNGINTVYQVGASGTLPTAATGITTTINPLPGFPTFLANSTTPPAPFTHGFYPFGIWFANATTLYVADEGDGVIADAGNDLVAGLEKWTFNGTDWVLDYTLQNGLGLGVDYNVPSPAGNTPYPTVATDGLRNITGVVDGNGDVTIYAATSTVSTSGDQGADPNEIVSIVDDIAATTLPGSEEFSVIDGPDYGVVYRGVALNPVPEPAPLPLLAAAFAALSFAYRRVRQPGL
jgi:hypothetical protein